MHDVKASIKVLQLLKDMSIKVAMDNFGTGYLSLRCLKYFSLDILKIGRLLTYDRILNPDDSEIIATIIALTKETLNKS